MLLSQQHLRRFSAPIPNHLFPPISPFPFPHSLNFPSNQRSRCSAPKLWMAELSEEPTTATSPLEEGPVELPPSNSPLFATDDNPTPLQTATSVLLTGAITVFLFRSLRRRAKRAKETVLLMFLSLSLLNLPIFCLIEFSGEFSFLVIKLSSAYR